MPNKNINIYGYRKKKKETIKRGKLETKNNRCLVVSKRRSKERKVKRKKDRPRRIGSIEVKEYVDWIGKKMRGKWSGIETEMQWLDERKTKTANKILFYKLSWVICCPSAYKMSNGQSQSVRVWVVCTKPRYCCQSHIIKQPNQGTDRAVLWTMSRLFACIWWAEVNVTTTIACHFCITAR